MKKIVLLSFFLSCTYFLQSQVTLVKDINPGFSGSVPEKFIEFNEEFYFYADSRTRSPFKDYGKELYKSDGTSAGTILVKDINSGNGDSLIDNFTIFNNQLYFSASDGANGVELWKTDGTDGGTVLAANINPDDNSDPLNPIINSSNPINFKVFKDELYFSANNGTNGIELMKINMSGEVNAYNLASGSSSSFPEYLTIYNERLYFSCRAGVGGTSYSDNLLWYTDGTTPTIIAGPIIGSVRELILFNNKLFFVAKNFNNEVELWSHSTIPTEETIEVLNLNDNSGSNPANLTVLNNTLYFIAKDNSFTGAELCKYEPSGTSGLVKDIRDGSSSSSARHLTVYNNKLYFVALDGINSGYRLWSSDGTENGTEIISNSISLFDRETYYPIVYNDDLYFTGNDGTNGYELWKTKGSNASTVLVSNIKTGAANSNPSNFFVFNNELYFKASTNSNGTELLKYAPQDFFNGASLINSNNWSETTNWDTGSLPTSTSRIIIPATKEAILNIDDVTLETLEVRPNAKVTILIDKELTITEGIINDGEIRIKSNKDNSGVLLMKGASATGNGDYIYERGGLLKDDWSIVSTPVKDRTKANGGGIISFYTTNSSRIKVKSTDSGSTKYAIGSYNHKAATNKWTYFSSGSNSSRFQTAQGYSLGLSDTSPDTFVEFKGDLLFDNQEYSSNISNTWKALGNPFTAYLNVNDNTNTNFLTTNTDNLHTNFKAIYIWNNVTKNYDPIGIDDTDYYLPPGQGFFIRTKENATAIQFLKNSLFTQPNTGSAFQKSNNKKQSNNLIKLKLNLDTDTIQRYTEFRFSLKGSKTLDAGYDLGLFENDNNNLSIWSNLVENNVNEKFCVQTLHTNEFETEVLPIEVSSKLNSDVVFSLETTNLPNGSEIYLEDKQLNTITKLSDSNSNYTVNLAENTIESNRFYLHTSNTTLSTNTIDLYNVTIKGLKNKIAIENKNNKDLNVTIYSILGKQILKENIATSKSFTITTKGVYLVRLFSSEGLITKKIIVQ